MRALLDVNLLNALHDWDHVHHTAAAHWFERHAEHGWASCPSMQNGCLRIMSQPGYTHAQPLAVLIGMQKRSTATDFHEQWSDDIGILDSARFHHAHMHSHRQLTDLYLLGFAVNKSGRLVSFDLQIPLSAVYGATASHLATP